MPYTGTIEKDADQGNGTRIIRIRYDHDAGGPTITNKHKVTASFDINAHIAAVEARQDVRQPEKALRRVVSAFARGEDPELQNSPFHTRAQIRNRQLRFYFNTAKEAQTDERAARKLALMTPRLAAYTNAQIAGIVGWTEQQVSDARAKVDAFISARANLDHGNGDL